MDIERLYRDYNVPHATEGHKHCRPGWINTECPFCSGNAGLHLGYNTDDDYFYCWRCGHHNIVESIASLLHINKYEVRPLIKQYGIHLTTPKDVVKKVRIKPFKLPSDLVPLTKQAKKYLINRNFNPTELERIWGLSSTSIISKLDKLSYKHRIVIPYYWNNKIVSFDSRDITNKAMNKYQACSSDREEIPHKDILYGIQSEWGEVGICVEGATDVWRLGVKSFAVSGIKYKTKQVRLIAKHFKEVAVVFDPDPQAIIQANKLVADLKFRGVVAYRVDIDSDPGDLSNKEAKSLVHGILKGKYR